jgi:peptidoglycan hydrolase-like protein with peptidoglycan-binding domain
MSLEDGVRAFQKMEGMEETGTVDDALRSKLQEKAAQ